MRTYKILEEKARRFNADPEIQGLLAEARQRNGAAWLGAYGRDAAAELRRSDLDPDRLAARGLGYERLDQLTTEILLGVR
jgi:xylose isomerase